MDIRDYVKVVLVEMINIVKIFIEVGNNHVCKEEGWSYINNFDWGSIIADVKFNNYIELISGFDYNEWDTDANLCFSFVNINNKKLDDFKEMVDIIGEYIYNTRKDKRITNTTMQVESWLCDNLNELIDKYR